MCDLVLRACCLEDSLVVVAVVMKMAGMATGTVSEVEDVARSNMPSATFFRATGDTFFPMGFAVGCMDGILVMPRM